MTHVVADFQHRQHVIFSARGRTFANSRVVLPDGPAGFTSTELLLAAVAHCSLGTLLNHPEVIDAPIASAVATLDAEMAEDPARIARIAIGIALFRSGAVLPPVEVLEGIACNCPMCNTVAAEKTIRVTISTDARPQPTPAVPVR